MSFRNVSASLTLDTSGYRRALSEAAADTRRLIDQLQGIARVAGMDGVTADVHQLDRALGEVPDTARAAGSSAASAFDGFEAELEQLDDRARAVAREQRQIADAAVEASRRAGGAYRTIGTEAAQAAASARSSLTGLSGVHVGITTSAERAATAEGAIGVAATRSATTARGALSGMAGAHDVVEKEAIQARLAELGIGTAAVSAAELAQRSALEMARSLNVITAAAERAAAAETLIGTSAERAALLAARANTVSGGGGGRTPGGPSVAGGAAEVGALAGMANTWRTISSVAGGLAAFQGFTMLTRGIREAVVGASDLNESLNKTKFTFGEATPVVVNLANEMRTSFGQSRTAILDAASNFGLIGKAAGLAQPEAAGLSSRLARLAVDAQSFFNVPLPDVLQAFRSGLVGEAEPMRRFGVLLDEASVKSHAYAVGIARVGSELTQAEKVQSRFDLILNAPALKAAEGDMERTADQFANRMRIIGGRLKEWAVDVGAAAIPEILKLVDALEEAGRRAGPGVAAAFEKIGGAISAAFDRLRPFFANMVEIGGDLWHILLQITDAVGPFVAALGGIAAVGVISALNGLSDVLSSITGFLAENEGLVKALAIAYGVSLVPRLAQAATGMLAFSRATAGATAASGGGAFARVAGSLLSIAPAATNAVRGFDGVGGAAARAASTSAAGWGNTHRALGLVSTASATATIGMTETGRGGFRAGQQVATGMQRAADSIGRVRVGALGIGLALAEGVMAVRRGWERQAEGASNWAEKQFGSAPRANVKQMVASINEIETQYNRLLERTTKGRDNIGQKIIQAPFHAFGKEVMSPGLKAEADQRDELLRKRNKEVEALRRYESVLNNVSRRTGMTRDETEKFAASQYDLGTSTKENSNKIVASWESTQQAAAKAGVSTEDFAAAAAKAGLSLAEGGEDAQKQITAAITEIDNLGNAAGVSGAQVLDMFNQDTAAAKAFLTAVVDVGDKVKGAFLADVDVTTHVNADPKAIADAQKQMADLQSQGKPIPMELQLETQGPLEQLKKFYAQAVEQGKAFGDNARKALALGFDPDLIQRLMLQGPEKAGPLLAALVSQSGAALVGLVNTQEAELRRQSSVVQEIATKQMIDTAIVQSLTTKAVQDESGKRTATLSEAVKVQRAIVLLGEGATLDAVAAQTGLKTAQITAVIDAWGFKLFAAIDSTMGRFQAGGTSGHGGAQFKAQGAVDLGHGRVGTVQGDRRNAHQPEIVRGGTWRVFAEDETQGESYIPHAMDRRPRAQSLLAQTARILGMVAMPEREFRARLDRDTVRLADGAVVARHEWVGGSQRRGPTTEGPSSIAPPRPTIDRLRERVERFAFGGLRDVRRSERERSGAVHHVSDRRATERQTSTVERLQDRFIGRRQPMASQMPPGASAPADHPALPQSLPHPRRESRSGHRLGRGEVTPRPRGFVVEHLQGDREVTAAHGLLRFALGGLKRADDRLSLVAAHVPGGQRTARRPLDHVSAGAPPSLAPGVPPLMHRQGASDDLDHPRGVVHQLFRLGRVVTERDRTTERTSQVRDASRLTDRQRGEPHTGPRPAVAEADGGHVGAGSPLESVDRRNRLERGQVRDPVHQLLRFAFGGLRRERFETSTDRQRVSEHGIGRPSRAVALEALLNPVQGAGHVVPPAAHRAGADVVATHHDDPGSTLFRLGHGLQRFPIGELRTATGQPRLRRELLEQGGLRPVIDREVVRPVRLRDDVPAFHRHDVAHVRDVDAVGHGVHAPTVRRFAQGGTAESSLPPVPIKELAPYNVGPEGAGKRGLDTTTIMRQTAVQKLTQREQDINRLKLAIATQKGGGTVGGGKIDSGWSNITNYLMTKGVNFIATSTTGGSHVAGSYHYRGKAVDLVGTGKSSMSTIFDTLAMVGSSLSELFYDPKGWFIKNGAQVKGAIGGHSDHVHAATFRMGGVVEEATGKALPRQRPFEKERIRRGRDVIEHGPLGLPRRDPVRSKVVASLRDVLVPKGKAMASGGLTEIRAAGAAQPYVRFARGGVTSPTPLLVHALRGVAQASTPRAHGDLRPAVDRLGARPEMGQWLPGIPRTSGADVRPARHAADVVSLRPGVSPQRERPARPIRQGRDVRDHPHLRLAPLQRDLKHVSHFEVGGVFDRRDRPGHVSSSVRARQADDGRRQPFGLTWQLDRQLMGMHRDHRPEAHVPQVPYRRVAVPVADLNPHVPQVMRDTVEAPRSKRERVLDRYDVRDIHALTLRREASVARGAQPDIRLARGGIAPPTGVGGVVHRTAVGRDERGPVPQGLGDRFGVRHISGPGMAVVDRTRDTRTTTAEHYTHSRGLPQSQRMEAPAHARRAALGVHLLSPTATRHTSETVTMDGRRHPLGRPTEDARWPSVKADRSHSTHAMRWGGLVGGITRSVAEFFGFAWGGTDVLKERDHAWNRTAATSSTTRETRSRTASAAVTGLPSTSTTRVSSAGDRSRVASESRSASRFERDTRRDTSRTMQVAPFDLRRATADSSLALVPARPGSAARPRAGGGKAGDRPLRIGDLAMARLPSFAKGGTVPGALGEPRVIVAHGGEQVQPVQPIHLGAPGGGGATFDVTTNVTVGQLGGDVDLDDIRRDVQNAVEAGVKKAGDRFLAGVHRGG